MAGAFSRITAGFSCCSGRQPTPNWCPRPNKSSGCIGRAAGGLLRTQCLFFPVYARYRAGIDRIVLDLLLGSAIWIETLRFAVVGETKDAGKVVNAEAATNALLLIYPWFSAHSDLLSGFAGFSQQEHPFGRPELLTVVSGGRGLLRLRVVVRQAYVRVVLPLRTGCCFRGGHACANHPRTP